MHCSARVIPGMRSSGETARVRRGLIRVRTGPAVWSSGGGDASNEDFTGTGEAPAAATLLSSGLDKSRMTLSVPLFVLDALSIPIMLRALTPRYRQWVLACDHAFAFVWRATLLSTPNWSIRLFGRRIFTAVLNRQRGAYDAISARCADLSSSLSAAARLRILFTACQQSAIGIEWYSPCKVYAIKAPGIGTRVAKRGPAASKSSSSPSDASSYVCSVFVCVLSESSSFV